MSVEEQEFSKAKEAWEKARAKYADKIKPKKNLSGIPIKTVYTPDDIADLDLSTMPGVFPYTRGLYPDGYALTPWAQQMVFGYGTVDETRAKMKSLVAQGMEGYFGNNIFNMVLDVPSMYGIDSDHPEAEGNVGQCGVVLCTIQDYDELISGWELEKSNFSLITGDNCLPALAMIAAAAERSGKTTHSLRGNSMNWYPRTAVQDIPSWDPEYGYMLMADLIKWASVNAPSWNTANIFLYGLSEAGATPAQELGYGLAWGKSVIDACKEAGMQADDFMGRLGFQIGLQCGLLEEVAKLRAHRRMWAKIAIDAGAVKPQSMHGRVHIHTAGNVLTAQQPLNNTARITLQILAGVLGGAQSIHSCSYDETIGIPTELSHRTALRSQQIIMWESGLREVADPLAGSYYVEWLTDQMEQAAWKIYNDVEARGGYKAGLADGSIKREIDNASYQNKLDIKSSKKIVVGLNKYITEEHEKQEPFRVDQVVEEKAKARLAAFKAMRNQKDVDAALEAVRVRCAEFKERKGDLMPVLVHAAHQGATNGEMCAVMRDAFGWFVSE